MKEEVIKNIEKTLSKPNLDISIKNALTKRLKDVKNNVKIPKR